MFRISEQDVQLFRSNCAVAPFRSGGFTRVELLVVMAIITLMMSLILPGIQNTREAARRQQCNNSLRALCLVNGDFSSRNKNSLPDLGGMNLGWVSDDAAEIRFFFAIAMGLFAAIDATLGAIVIWAVVRYVNRRDNRRARGFDEEYASSRLLGRWFCPPSSSPI